MRHWRYLILAVLAGLVLGALGTSDRAFGDDTIQPGVDLFQNSPPIVSWSDFSTTPIPAGFFDPGSDPFGGTIVLKGVPLSPGTTGLADTIVQRSAMISVPPPFPSVGATVPIQLVQLSLVSSSSITVTYSGVNPQVWRVSVGLSSNQPSQGTIAVTRNTTDGGTFSSQLAVMPLFTFTRISDSMTRTLDYPLAGRLAVQLSDSNVPWLFTCPPTVTTPAPNSNFCPGTQTSGRVLFQMSGPGAQGKWQLADLDTDGDGIGDSVDNCRYWYNPTQNLPQWPVPTGDLNCDGFPDSGAPVGAKASDAFLGTNPLRHCAADSTPDNEPLPDAWPFDFNDDQLAGLADVSKYSSVFGSHSPGPPYAVRFDLNGDGRITLPDVAQYSSVFGKKCFP
jgi:hypothetical protein